MLLIVKIYVIKNSQFFGSLCYEFAMDVGNFSLRDKINF